MYIEFKKNFADYALLGNDRYPLVEAKNYSGSRTPLTVNLVEPFCSNPFITIFPF